MTELRIRFAACMVLVSAANETREVLGKRSDLPSLEVLERLIEAIFGHGPLEDGLVRVTVADDDVDALLRLIPVSLEELGDEPMEMSARMDALPHDLEDAQAELLAALGR